MGRLIDASLCGRRLYELRPATGRKRRFASGRVYRGYGRL